jgi:AbrB family looped-hinge helix DNA binding protein
MNLAKLSISGQIAVPVEIKKKLNLQAGDKILFLERSDGEIVISNASCTAINNTTINFDRQADKKSSYVIERVN